MTERRATTAATPTRAGVAVRAALALLGAGLLAACAGTPFAPEPITNPATLPNLQTAAVGEVTVSAALLDDEQARRHFGADLGAANLQALWLRIRNASDRRYWLIRNVIDPDLYSADEAATLVRQGFSDDDFERLRQHFRDESLRVMMAPGYVTQGLLFLPREEGGRYVEVRLTADSWEAEEGLRDGTPPDAYEDLRLGFGLTLPDGTFDYERLDVALLYDGVALPDLDAEALRARLESLPCCARNEDGDAEGDPLNLVIVGEERDVMNALSRAGWSFTHRITPRTMARMVGAALSGESYAVAPVSSLYAFGRKQDIALQRARRNIAQRNHMRLWLAPFTHRGKSVWVGQVSRDIGVKATTHSPTLTTHVIDPEVDVTREYLLHGLLAEGFVEQFGFVAGSRAATAEDPALNLAADPYFSDGLRLVVFLSTHPVPFYAVRNLFWERSAPPVAEGQTEAARRNSYPIGDVPDDP